MATIIPTSIAGFNRYLNQTNALLIEGSPENYTRYNWTADNLTAWQEFQTEWLLIFDLYDNVATYTTSGKDGLLVIIENAINYANENRLILLLKATQNLTPAECIIFNIPKSYARVMLDTHPATTEGNKTIATLESVFAHLIPKAGGMVRVKAFPEVSSSGRAHKLHNYDLLEYAAGVFYSDEANLPTHADDPRLKIAHNSRASFILQTLAMINNLPPLEAGAKAPAKILVIFFRWAKSKHPNLDGPWSVAYTTVLL